MAKKVQDESRTYKGTMRMCEAKILAQSTWPDAGIVFNGKPTSVTPTYKVGRIVVGADKKSTQEWLGVGFDWESAFKAAKIVVPASAIKVVKAAKAKASPAAADTIKSAHKAAVAKIAAAHPLGVAADIGAHPIKAE